MVKSDKISHFLPICFRNGDRVQQFAKKCPHCGKTVSAAQMHGIAANINERILLAARAECSQCHCRFPVTCVITAQKRVMRVALPLWLYRFYIRMLMRSTDAGTQQPLRAPAVSAPPAAQPANAEIPLDQVVTALELLGSYQGKPIYSWIEHRGKHYDFSRVTPNPQAEKLACDECLLNQTMIYKLRCNS